MSARAKFQALSSRDSFGGGSQYAGQCQRCARLAHLCRFCPEPDRHRPTVVCQESFGVDLQETVYALDTTTIDLCLSVFPWAVFRTAKAAIKLHTLLDLRGNIPTFIHISDGKVHEVNVLDQLLPEPGAFYIMDRGFLDFERLYRFHEAGSFFVTRGKSNLKVQRRYSHPVDRTTGLICDQSVVLTGFYSQQGFEAPLRRIRFKDPETAKTLIFLTNNFVLPAFTITELYRCRWQVGVSRQGHINQSVKVRPRPGDSSLVAGEAPWRESKTVMPSDNILGKEYAQRTRLQRTVNADVASLHENPVAETVYNARKQQELTETSPMRQLSPAGYQRRHGVKADVSTGEALGARRRNLAEEALAITVSGKCRRRHQGDGSGRSTDDGREVKHARREGPGPVSTPFVKVRQG